MSAANGACNCLLSVGDMVPRLHPGIDEIQPSRYRNHPSPSASQSACDNPYTSAGTAYSGNASLDAHGRKRVGLVSQVEPTQATAVALRSCHEEPCPEYGPFLPVDVQYNRLFELSVLLQLFVLCLGVNGLWHPFDGHTV